MTDSDARAYRRDPLHPGLIGSGATLLMATLVTDFLYWRTTLFQWNNFSGWLLTGGLVLAALAGIALVIDLLLKRVTQIAWLRFAGIAAAALLSLLNAFVHSRDAYTAVIPEGITLSAVVTVLLLLIGVGGWSLQARRAPALQTREARP